MLFADDVLLASYCVAGLQRQTGVLKYFADLKKKIMSVRPSLLYSEKEGSLQPMRFGGMEMRR